MDTQDLICKIKETAAAMAELCARAECDSVYLYPGFLRHLPARQVLELADHFGAPIRVGHNGATSAWLDIGPIHMSVDGLPVPGMDSEARLRELVKD